VNLRELENAHLKGGKIIFMAISGSGLHGTTTENSDTDYKGVYLPTFEEFMLRSEASEIHINTAKTGVKNTKEDVDITLYSLPHFLKQVSAGEVNAVETLYAIPSNATLFKTRLIEKVYNNRELFVKRESVKAFIGFAQKHAKRDLVKGKRIKEVEEILNFILKKEKELGIKTVSDRKKNSISSVFLEIKQEVLSNKYEFVGIRANEHGEFLDVLGRMYKYDVTFEHIVFHLKTLVNKYGGNAQESKTEIRWKTIAHSVRALKEALDILNGKDIVFPLPYRDELLDIKTGKCSMDEVTNKIEALFLEIDKKLNEVNRDKSENKAKNKAKRKLMFELYSEAYGI